MARLIVWACKTHAEASWMSMRLHDLDSAVTKGEWMFTSEEDGGKWLVKLECRVGRPEPRPKQLERLQAWCEALCRAWSWVEWSRTEG